MSITLSHVVTNMSKQYKNNISDEKDDEDDENDGDDCQACLLTSFKAFNLDFVSSHSLIPSLAALNCSSCCIKNKIVTSRS